MSESEPDWKMFELELYSYTNNPAELVEKFYDAGSWKRVCCKYKTYLSEQNQVELEECL